MVRVHVHLTHAKNIPVNFAKLISALTQNYINKETQENSEDFFLFLFFFFYFSFFFPPNILF